MPSRNPVDADGLLLVSEAAIPSTPPAPALTPPLSLPARSLAMASNAASFFTAQCPYTASTCPLLAPFALDFKAGGSGAGAPSPSACASAHSSPAPGTLAAAAPNNANASRLNAYDPSGGVHLPYPSASPGGQLMLDGRAPYADGAVDGSPTVSLHSRPHMSAPSGADHQGSSCAPGQCSTPDTCNPPAPAPYQQQQQQQAQYSYDPHAQGRRPDFARKVSASSGSHLTAASDSPDYTSAGGGSYGTQGATPASSIMQSPPIEPVHLQRPVFGQPSPGQSYQNDLSLPSPSALFSVSSYDNEQDGHRLSQYPPPTPAYPYQQQQPSSSSQQQQNQQQQRLPIYGSYGTCDVEDLLGASAYEPFDERKPDLRRAVSDPSAAPPAMLAPPLPAPPALSQSASADAVPTAGGSAAAAASGEQTAFISKLWHLLTHAEYERYLRWNTAGDAFILTNANEFAIRVLPRFFRHSNVASFIRQLNLYSFSRVSTIRLLDMADASTSTAIIPHSQPADLDGTAPDHAHHHHGDSDSDAGSAHSGEGGQAQASPVDASIAASGFSHPNFLRGRPDLLRLLKPRGSSKKNVQSKKASMAVAAEKAKNAGASGGGSRKK